MASVGGEDSGPAATEADLIGGDEVSLDIAQRRDNPPEDPDMNGATQDETNPPPSGERPTSAVMRAAGLGYSWHGVTGKGLLPDLPKMAPAAGLQTQVAELTKSLPQSTLLTQQAVGIGKSASAALGVGRLAGQVTEGLLSPGLKASVTELSGVLSSHNLPRSALGAGTAWSSVLAPHLDGLGTSWSSALTPNLEGLGAHTALSSLLNGVKFSEALLPRTVAGPAMLSVGQMSRVALSDSAFTQWRSSLGVQSHLAGVVGTLEGVRVKHERIEALLNLSSTTTALSQLTSDMLGSRSVLGTRPMLELENYVNRLAGHPLGVNYDAAWSAWQGVSGLVSHDALTAVGDGESADEVISTVESKVVIPWEEAASTARHLLYERLDEFDPRISELLRGAWDSVAHPGPADVVKVGHCAVEALLWALRLAAPDDEVKRWVSSSGRRVEEFVRDGKVTRSARVRYTLRNRKGDIKLVESQAAMLAAAVTATHERLQATKHASAGDLTQARSHLMTTEAILSQLFAVR